MRETSVAGLTPPTLEVLTPAADRTRRSVTPRSASDSDVVARITNFNQHREPERLALKYGAMRASAFAFFRGTAHLFWDDWPEGGTLLDDAPHAWVCGDLHLENFGSYRGDNGLTYFDLNDFDEAALAPATRDLARFVTSVHLAAATLHLSAGAATELSRIFLSAYVAALEDGKARWLERSTARGMVRELLRGVKQRTREALLDLRVEFRGRQRRLKIDGVHALKASRADRALVIDCLRRVADAHQDRKFFKVIDVARRVAGTGSLGVSRFVVLVRGHGSPNGNFLLDLKEELPSALSPRLGIMQPVWRHEADRVVHVQRWMQAIPPALLETVEVGHGHYVMRELQPLEDRLALEHWHGKLGRLQRVMSTMGEAVGWAQLRSASRNGSVGVDELMAFSQAKSWRRAIMQYAREYAVRATRDWKRFAAATIEPARPAP
jgi:uncharacterized protein (DUF2252 family)